MTVIVILPGLYCQVYQTYSASIQLQHSFQAKPRSIEDGELNTLSAASPDTILPPARADNNSPDGSIQTAPSPLPPIHSPIQSTTPPPLLLGGWQNNWPGPPGAFTVGHTGGAGGILGGGGPPHPFATPPFHGRFSPLQVIWHQKLQKQ